MAEAPLEQTEFGLVPKGPGWFVLNAREAAWEDAEGRGAICSFESRKAGGESDFSQVGINVRMLRPGEPMAMYHREADQEDFLVLSGEALAIVEGEERPLKAWDFLHCPAGAKHTLVATGTEPCVLVAVGSRTKSKEDPDRIAYPVEEAALRHGAGVEVETKEPDEAYANVPHRQSARYREGWLP